KRTSRDVLPSVRFWGKADMGCRLALMVERPPGPLLRQWTNREAPRLSAAKGARSRISPAAALGEASVAGRRRPAVAKGNAGSRSCSTLTKGTRTSRASGFVFLTTCAQVPFLQARLSISRASRKKKRATRTDDNDS